MQSSNLHFLQSEAWQRFQGSLGRRTIRGAGEGWEYLAIVESGRGNRRLYCPYGPMASDKTALAEAIASLKSHALKLKCDFVRVEPIGNFSILTLRNLGLIKAKRNFQPAHTWCVDLSPTTDEIIAQMSATNRNLHRNISKKDVTFTTSNNPHDIDKLIDLLHVVAERNGIKQHADDYFIKQAEMLLPKHDACLYFAWLGGKCIAASLVYDSPTTRYYAHAAASDKYRKLQVSTPMVSKMILDAKEKGLKSFDLYGVAPPGKPNHPWAGITRFKQSFGGQAKDYLGTWELPIHRTKYWLYHTLQKSN